MVRAYSWLHGQESFLTVSGDHAELELVSCKVSTPPLVLVLRLLAPKFAFLILYLGSDEAVDLGNKVGKPRSFFLRFH